MPAYLGSNAVDLSFGSDAVSEAYLGSTLVYRAVHEVEMFPDLTTSGTWTPKNHTSDSGTASASVSASAITLQGRNNSWSWAYPANKIDFTNISKVWVTYTTTVSGSNSNRWFYVMAHTSVPSSYNQGVALFTTSSAESQTVEIDVGEISGEQYLYVSARAYITGTPRINVTITEIKYE